MKRLFIFVLITGVAMLRPLKADTPDPKDGVRQAAMDYMDGAHAGDAERVARTIHPELHKVSVAPLPNGHRGRILLPRAMSQRPGARKARIERARF